MIFFMEKLTFFFIPYKYGAKLTLIFQFSKLMDKKITSIRRRVRRSPTNTHYEVKIFGGVYCFVMMNDMFTPSPPYGDIKTESEKRPLFG